MSELNRRNFVKLSGATALGIPFLSFSDREPELFLNKTQQKVKFTRDGIDFSPEEYAALLSKLLTKNKLVVDSYSRGGVVEDLEKKFADILGKESAVFMPTGTLANHIAIRKLADNRKKVIVQAESHIYNDSGDCAQNLSGLNLIPLAEGKTTFTLAEVKNAINRTDNGRVKTDIGAIMIESPVRRTDNEMFDYDEMKKISVLAIQNNIKMHLDGARLFNAVAHSKISAKEYAKLFDTVYISMYKNFNAASGAILAGTKEFCKDLYHIRRMFGGGMPQVWPFALVALNYADSFLPEYKKAMRQFDNFSRIISKEKQFKIEKVTNGTNVFKLYVDTPDIESFKNKLAKENIILSNPSSESVFKLKINTTLNNMPVELLVSKFKQSV
ncbi:MAG: hypothetical protein DRI95_08945 [Bacteroidetes bacterium]|nr:MAG: hypothetical protein DRI95_08945 [Bacteroidota bacterium]